MRRILKLTPACIVAFFCALCCGLVRGEDVRELPAYMIVSDDFVTQATNSPDAIFFSYDPKHLTAKLAEFGLRFPENKHFPQGGLFIITITDHIQEAFDRLSGDLKKHLIIVDLMVDKESKPPKASGPAKKTSRVLLTWCDPIRDIKSFAIKRA